MDDIITLIFIIIAVVSAIGRIKAKQKPKSGAGLAASNDLGTKLKAFFADIQRRLEEQVPKDPSGDSRWDRLKQADRAKEPPVQSYELSLEDLDIDLEEEKKTAAPVRKPPVQPARMHAKPAGARPVDAVPAPCAHEPLPLTAKATPCPEFLRRAVVWSEILGPPAALRNAPWER